MDITHHSRYILKELGYKIDQDPQSISRDINPTDLYLQELCKDLDINLTESESVPILKVKRSNHLTGSLQNLAQTWREIKNTYIFSV